MQLRVRWIEGPGGAPDSSVAWLLNFLTMLCLKARGKRSPCLLNAEHEMNGAAASERASKLWWYDVSHRFSLLKKSLKLIIWKKILHNFSSCCLIYDSVLKKNDLKNVRKYLTLSLMLHGDINERNMVICWFGSYSEWFPQPLQIIAARDI